MQICKSSSCSLVACDIIGVNLRFDELLCHHDHIGADRACHGEDLWRSWPLQVLLLVRSGPRRTGRPYHPGGGVQRVVIHDVFIYGGAILIFLSLIWWVFWYSGNIDVPPEELEDDVGLIKYKNKKLSRAVRRVSDRISDRIRNSFRKKGRDFQHGPSGDPRPSNSGTDIELSTIYDNPKGSSSKELVREALSI